MVLCLWSKVCVSYVCCFHPFSIDMIMCVQVVGFDMVIYNHDYFTLFSLLYPTKVGLSLACDGMGDLDVRK
jgi:hypothetical protein